MLLRSAHSSHVGLPAIGANDDRVFVDESKKLFALLDGSGPTYGGHHESKGVDLALQVFLEVFTESAEEEPTSRLLAAFAAANDSLLAEGGPLPGGLTHCTAALTVGWFLNGKVFIGHVGESCVFHWHSGELKQIVPPDTAERMLLEQGEGPELAALHRSAPVKRLGFRRAEPSISMHEVRVGDVVLLCTDGVWSSVSDSTLATLVDDAARGAGELSRPTKICDAVLREALRRVYDNVSIIVIERFG